MGISRKEFLRQSGILGLSLIVPPDNHPFWGREKSVGKESGEQKKWEAGLDGQTVWEANNLPVQIKQLGTGLKIHEITIDKVYFQMFKPKLGKTELVLFEDERTKNSSIRRLRLQEVTVTIPTITGMFAHFEANLGYLYGGSNKWDFSAKPIPKDEVLGSYMAIDRFYDNKIVNATIAVLSLSETMKEKAINPGEEFSYLTATKLGELESNNNAGILMGKGLVSGKEKGKMELVPMFGGGICVSVATIAKMARQAEELGLVEITDRKPHGYDQTWWYFMNPDDPTKNQVDATAAFPGVDFKFKNKTDKSLYVVPRVQIIPDSQNLVPKGYNGFDHSTAFFVLSTSLRTYPVSEEEVLSVKGQLSLFRKLRKI